MLSIEERFKNKEPIDCIFNAQRLEFDVGPPLLLSRGSSDGGGEGISGWDGGGDNEIRKKILIIRDFHVQLKEMISFLQECKMDLNNLKYMLKTKEKNCTFLDFELLLLMLSFMKAKEFIPNATTFFIQQKPRVVFVKKYPLLMKWNLEISHLVELENSLKQQSEEITKLISLLDKHVMEEAHKVAMKLADMVVECTEAHTHNLKQFILPPKNEQKTKPNP